MQNSTPNRSIEFRRLEIKYFVDRPQSTALRRDLECLMRPDEYAGPDGTYKVRSLYFDTPDYMAYHEKLAGVAIRHKLRMRVYGNPSDTNSIRMELKSRYVSFIHKLATDISCEEYELVRQTLHDRVAPPAHLLRNGVNAREFFRVQRQYNMQPKVIVEYRRRAYERKEISRTRVNFDDELRASRALDLFGSLRGARRILMCDRSIFEIKVDGVMPFWLHTLITKYNLQNQAISKYCYAVRSEALLTAELREDE